MTVFIKDPPTATKGIRNESVLLLTLKWEMNPLEPAREKMMVKGEVAVDLVERFG